MSFKRIPLYKISPDYFASCHIVGETSTEEPSVEELPQEPSPPPSSKFGCSLCNVGFADADELRRHVKDDWHLCNLQRKLAGKLSLSEEEFDKMADDHELGSISGSDDSDIEDEDGAPVKIIRTPQVICIDGKKERFSVRRSVLAHPSLEHMSSSELESRLHSLAEIGTSKWAVLLCHGGHFAGAVYHKGQVVVHKTFHRYVVRKKAGGRQVAYDSGGKQPKSAGATIRRHNEMLLQEDINRTLGAWSGHLEGCRLIFIHAPGTLNTASLFNSPDTPLRKEDPRIRSVPITTRRPTLSEAQRVYFMLCSVVYGDETSMPTESVDTVDGSRRTSVSPGRRAPVPAPQRKAKPKFETKDFSSDSESQSGEESLSEEELEDVVSVGDASLRDSDANIELMTACRIGDLRKAGLLLIDGGVNVNGADARGNTALHIASIAGAYEIVSLLLSYNADPTLRDIRNRTPYEVAKDKTTRNAFRKYMAIYPDRHDYAAAQIPSGLTDEMEEAQKAAAKKKKKKAKSKPKKETPPPEPTPTVKLESSTPKLTLAVASEEKLSLREQMARAAEARMAALKSRGTGSNETCAQCKKSLDGIVPYERLTYKYCSSACVQEHRKVLG